MIHIGAGKNQEKPPKEQVAEIKRDKPLPKGDHKGVEKGASKAAYVPTPASRKNIIRVMGTDLNGDAKMSHALTAIKGIGYNFARAVIYVSGVDRETRLLDIKEETLIKLEEIIKNPTKFGIPPWLVNRQKDYATGNNIHFTGNDLSATLREDLNRLKKIRSYRGIRHELGQPTRGQRTKSSFRTGRSVGVQKRKDAKAGR